MDNCQLDQFLYTVQQNQCYRLQVDEQSLYSEYRIILEQDAQLDMQIVLYQVASVDCAIYLYLKGERSQATITGLYALDGDQQVNIKTYQYHEGRDSKSNLVMKGMLKDKARANYQGLIKIAQGAHGTDASQENKNIVLSAEAKVVSVPSIEVLQHDVQCCHGSAIGKFDREQLWYLQSKGFDSKQAYELLTRSFFQSVLGDDNPEIMERICQKMI